MYSSRTANLIVRTLPRNGVSGSGVFSLTKSLSSGPSRFHPAVGCQSCNSPVIFSDAYPLRSPSTFLSLRLLCKVRRDPCWYCHHTLLFSYCDIVLLNDAPNHVLLTVVLPEMGRRTREPPSRIFTKLYL